MCQGLVKAQESGQVMSALSTLYGSPDQSATALAGNVGGQAREQETWTPDWIVEVARQAMGGIQLDPCGASNFDSYVTMKKTKHRTEKVNPITGGWFADVTLVKPGTHEGLVQSPHGGTVVCLDGLAQDWTAASSFFLNEPFDDLETWFRKAAFTCTSSKTKGVMIGPFRPHRVWFPELAKTCQDFVTLGYAVKFKGHLDACPFPLFLGSWNCAIPDLGNKETGRWTVR